MRNTPRHRFYQLRAADYCIVISMGNIHTYIPSTNTSHVQMVLLEKVVAMYL